jgi:Fe-S-cluster containining protein
MLRDAVMQAATHPDLPAAVARVYENLQREIDARKPVCTASGRCCRFEEFGHRLYVTTIELAAFVASLRPLLPLHGTPGRGQGSGASDVPRQSSFDSPINDGTANRPGSDSTRPSPLSPTLSPGYREAGARGGCPYQVDGLCSVHTVRPFGCRVFFCDATSDDWQHQQYERFHADLKRLHEEFAVPYRYVEWREALRQLDLVPPRGLVSLAESTPPDRKRLSLPQLPL